MVSAQLASGRAFEVVEAQLGLFLRIWSDDVLSDGSGELRGKCAALLVRHRQAWSTVEALLQHNLCLVQHFSSLQ